MSKRCATCGKKFQKDRDQETYGFAGDGNSYRAWTSQDQFFTNRRDSSETIIEVWVGMICYQVCSDYCAEQVNG